MKLFENKLFLLFLALFLFGLYFCPYFIKGKDSYILVHDNLDILNARNIFDGKYIGHVFPSDTIEDFYFPGAEKIFFVDILSLDRLFFKVFGYWGGYVFNEIFYRLLGFLGLFFLLGRIDTTKEFPDVLKVLISFAFVSLPFFPGFNLSVAGLPLLVLLFHNLYLKKAIVLSSLGLFLFTFYTRLLHAGAFVIFVLIITAIVLAVKKKLHRYFTLGIVILAVGWVISHYMIFLLQLYYRIPTTRVEMQPSAFFGVDFIGMLKGSLHMFLHGNFHARIYHLYVIVPSLILLGIYLGVKKRFYSYKIALLLLAYTVFASLVNGLSAFNPLLDIYGKLNIGFNFGRFFILSPAAWYLMWAVVLINFYKVFPLKKIAYYFIMALLCFQVGFNATQYTKKAYSRKPSFKEFLSTEQFTQIKKELKIDENARIGCIGFFPSVANYNGLKTIGGYKNLYPLAFKHKFYPIIKDELAKNKGLEKYFLKWGSRAYLFDDKIGTYYGNQHHIKAYFQEITCDLNIDELKKFGVEYIFSTAKITNAAEKKLALVFTSKKPRYYYWFYVYKCLRRPGGLF